MTKKIFISSIILLVSFFVSINYLQAENTLPLSYDPMGTYNIQQYTDLGTEDPAYIVMNLINMSLSFLGILSLLLILYAGLLWMTAAGEEEKIKKAQDILKGALIGLILIMASYGITLFVYNSLINVTNSTSYLNTNVLNATGLSNLSPVDITTRLINWALTFLGLGALILMLYAGFLWMTAAGEEEKIKEAQDILKGALIGLIIILASYSIGYYVFINLKYITNAA